MSEGTRLRPPGAAGLVVAWVVVAVAAVIVGVLAVGVVGDTIRDRGALVDESRRFAERPEGVSSPDPDEPWITDVVRGEYGEFEVACQGVYAFGLEVRPDTAAGWRLVSFEEGPDDDVDAVLSNRGRSVEMEIFCAQGAPAVAEIEWKTLPDDD